MDNEEISSDQADKSERQPHRVRLPGLLAMRISVLATSSST